MSVYTTEIASEVITSDNPIHQRLLKAYYLSLPYISGKVLEVGCGEGRGVELVMTKCDVFMGIDKIGSVIEQLQHRFPDGDFRQVMIPPFTGLEDNAFDTVISFQVIEHIKNDRRFLEEIYRVLKPGGKALISTPNIKMSLSRNPWHIREYTSDQLSSLARDVFPKVQMMGVAGNDEVMQYYEENKRSVQQIMKWDILGLQHKLPAFVLKLPYELLNRINRNKLKSGNDELVNDIRHTDYLLSKDPDRSLDLFCLMEK